jgi:hypothetical protein
VTSRPPRASRSFDPADTRRLVDFAGAVLFLLLQAAVWRAGVYLTDPSPWRWVGFGLLLATLALAVWRVARRRPAAWWTLAALVLQVPLALL